MSGKDWYYNNPNGVYHRVADALYAYGLPWCECIEHADKLVKSATGHVYSYGNGYVLQSAPAESKPAEPRPARIGHLMKEIRWHQEAIIRTVREMADG